MDKSHFCNPKYVYVVFLISFSPILNQLILMLSWRVQAFLRVISMLKSPWITRNRTQGSLMFKFVLSFLWVFTCTQAFFKKKKKRMASLVAQGIRIRPPMQETLIRSLKQEDPTCQGATRSTRHSYWACALEAGSQNYSTHRMHLVKSLCALRPMLQNMRSPCKEKPVTETRK